MGTSDFDEAEVIYHGYTYDVPGDFLKAEENALAGGLTQAELVDLGYFVLHHIETRTKKGLDYRDLPFRPYSTAYATFRALRGRNIQPVDMTFTGKMLAAADVKAGFEDGSIILYFTNEAAGRIAHYHNASLDEDPRPRRKIPQRRFFAIAQDSEVDELMHKYAEDVLRTRIADMMRQRGL